MRSQVIVDTGPLVALLNRNDAMHSGVVQQLRDIAPPLITCEAVLAEATYLTRHLPGARAALIEMVGDGFLRIGMNLADNHRAILTLIRRYHTVPMSLADACLVRLAEMLPHSVVFTLDNDFWIYRKNGRHIIEVLKP